MPARDAQLEESVMYIFRFLVLALSFLPTQLFAAPRPAGDAQRGEEMHAQVLAQFGGAYTEPKVAEYVAKLGYDLAQHSDQAEEHWRFTVLDTPIVNAFAFPGGYVYVTRGLLALADDEAELAGVLGHEIGHVTANHFQERNEKGAKAGIGVVVGAILGGLWNGKEGARDALETGVKLDTGYVAGHSREAEYEADLLGVKLLARAGYDPYAQAEFLESLSGQYELDARAEGKEYNPNRVDFFASHPATADRVRRAIRAAKREGVETETGRRGETEYFASIDGMVYGDTAEQGFVRGRRFEHPVMKFAYEVPEGFTITNSDRMVLAVGPGGAEMILDGGPAPRGRLDRFIADKWAPVVARGRKSGDLTGLERFTLDGVEGATGYITAEYKGAMRTVQLTVYRIGDRLYRFQGISLLDDDETRRALADAVRSFEHLTQAEANALQPYRIKIYQTVEGDTVNALSATIPMQNLREERFRLLNGYDDALEVNPGDRVKLILE